MKSLQFFMFTLLSSWSVSGLSSSLEKSTLIPSMPHPVAANAAVLLNTGNGKALFSFMGIKYDIDKKLSVSDSVWALNLNGSSNWQRHSSVPSKQDQKGRFATTATTIDNKAYLLGGYSTNRILLPSLTPNRINVSDFYSYDPIENSYQQLADMPVPVDDTVMLPYKNRYIYVVSGWHKEGAINLVQVFDTYKNEWFQASPLLNNGVFGHAGGIIDNRLLVCDGMQQTAQLAEASILKIEQGCWIGDIDVLDPTLIRWYKWVHPGEKGRFRMAAASDPETGKIWFVGGSEEIYDLEGLAVDKKQVQPSSEIWAYDATANSWQIFESPHASMDHKNLLLDDGKLLTIGGRDETGITGKILIHKRLSYKEPSPH